MSLVTKLRISRVLLYAAIGWVLSMFNVPFGGIIAISLITVLISVVSYLEGTEYES